MKWWIFTLILQVATKIKRTMENYHPLHHILDVNINHVSLFNIRFLVMSYDMQTCNVFSRNIGVFSWVHSIDVIGLKLLLFLKDIWENHFYSNQIILDLHIKLIVFHERKIFPFNMMIGGCREIVIPLTTFNIILFYLHS